MAQSPLRRNRRFERIAVPILLVLLVVVLGRQLRAATAGVNERCEIHVEHVDRAHADRHRHVHRDVNVDVIHDVDRWGHREVIVHVER